MPRTGLPLGGVEGDAATLLEAKRTTHGPHEGVALALHGIPGLLVPYRNTERYPQTYYTNYNYSNFTIKQMKQFIVRQITIHK